MQKKNVTFLVLLLAVQGQTALPHALDIESFRPVSTLMEDIHEGIVEVHAALRSTTVEIEHLIGKIERLEAEFVSRMGSSSLDVIRSSDKAYLQEMLDRIDELIATLEGVDVNKSVRLRDVCDQLKAHMN